MCLEKVKSHPTREDVYLDDEIICEITEDERNLVKQILLQELGSLNCLAFYMSVYACK